MDVVTRFARSQPDEPAIIDGDTTWSWAQFASRRNRLAERLRALGVEPGGNAVVLARNSAGFVLATSSLRAIGAIAVPMNHRLVGEEIAYILDQSDAVAVFFDDDFLARLEPVRATAAKVRHWVALGERAPEWATPLSELQRDCASAPAIEEAPSVGGSLIYTGGTTGRPKGAYRSGQDPAAVLRTMASMGLDRKHVYLAAGPLYHSAPFAFVGYTQLCGGTVVLMRKFDPLEAIRLIDRHRVSCTFMAPTLVKRIVDLPADVRARYDVSSMRSLVIAAAPCPTHVKHQALEYFGPSVYEFYGSTELGVNTVLAPADILRKPESCGRAIEGVEIRLLDDDGNAVAVGEPGELYVRRGASVFEGYYKNDQATAQMARGEWRSVGDVAWRDSEGFYYICDRKRDMIISAGVNIYPAEIEDVLHRHPAVEDVAVFGVPDDEWGERVHAAVKLRDGQHVEPEALRAWARERMADYKVPREISFHQDFPRDAAGKLLKRQLRDPYWKGKGRAL